MRRTYTYAVHDAQGAHGAVWCFPRVSPEKIVQVVVYALPSDRIARRVQRKAERFYVSVTTEGMATRDIGKLDHALSCFGHRIETRLPQIGARTALSFLITGTPNAILGALRAAYPEECPDDDLPPLRDEGTTWGRDQTRGVATSSAA